MTRWVSFVRDGKAASGVVKDGMVYPHPDAVLREILEAGELDEAAATALSQSNPQALSDLTLVAPLQPGSMRDSMCFHEHIRNCMGGEVDPRHSLFPVFYLSNAAAVIGPFDDAPIAPGSAQFDYELEIAAVIGRRGSNIPPAEAEQYIAGYTTYVDWSARDLQIEEMALGLGPAKGKDTATTLGPSFVTADEFEARRSGKGFDIEMNVSVNGEEISRGNWSTINWAFSDVVAYTSRGTTLYPGDILGSGTVGLGCLLEHFRLNEDAFRGWLQPGDVVETSVDLIGTTRQTVVASDVRHPLSSGW